MKKIITAINDKVLNEELRKNKDVEIICKDIQYKEGILEILEINFEIDYIFINYNLPGEISIQYLINMILKINENIKLIIFVKKENKNNYKFLENKNIKIILYENKININLLIDNKKNKLVDLKEKIVVKNIKLEKNKIKKKKYLENKLNKIKKEKINNSLNLIENKIITFTGNRGVGKSLIIINFAFYLKNKKILIIDYNLDNINIHNFFGVKKLNHNINKKSFFNNKKIKINKYMKIKNKFFEEYFNISILNNLIIKINKNINLLSYTKLINLKKINEINKYYDYIFIEFSENINKKIILNSYKNIILIEPNLIGINNSKKYLEKIYKINPKNTKIILNKNNNYSINENLLTNIFSNIKIIGKIDYKNIYNFLINNNFKNNYLLNLKKINQDYKKIFTNLK